MSAGWGCPHEVKGQCLKVTGRACDPGMKGCVLFGRFTHTNPAKQPPKGLKRGVGRKAPPKKH